MHDIKKKTFVLLEFQRARRAQKFYAGGLLLSSHKARGRDAQGNKTNTLTYRLYTVTSQLHCQHNTVHRGGDAQCNTTH